MSDTSTVALSCPKCGARLEITARISVFACSYCLANVMVERAGGIVSLSLVDAVSLVQKGTDKTAAELAISRLKVDLHKATAELEDYSDRTQELLNNIDRQHREQVKQYKIGAVAVPIFVVLIVAALINQWFPGSSMGSIVGLFCGVGTFILIRKITTRMDNFLQRKHTRVWNDRLPGLKRAEGAVETIEAQLDKNLQIANS